MTHEHSTEEFKTDWGYAEGDNTETTRAAEIDNRDDTIDTDETAITAPDDWLGSSDEDNGSDEPLVRRIHVDKYADKATEARARAAEKGTPLVTDKGVYGSHVVIRRGDQDYSYPVVQDRGLDGTVIGEPTEVTSHQDTPPPPEPPDISDIPSPDEDPQKQLVQQTKAVVSVIDRSTEAYLDGMKLVADDHGIFAPAAGREILEGLQAAGGEPGKTLVDLGSGDGRWTVVGGAVLGMDAHGYELSGERHELAREALGQLVTEGIIDEAGNSRIHLVQGDFMSADLPDADIYSYYAGSGVPLRRLEAKLLAEAPEGSSLILYRPVTEQITRLQDITPDPLDPMFTRIYRIGR